MNSLLTYYEQLMELSKINPIMSGIIGAWLATVVTLLCRNVPAKIWSFIKTQSIRSLTMNNVERTGINDDYIAFMYWFNHAKMWKWSRQWQRTEVRATGGSYNRVTVPGYSTHYFLWKGRLFWFTKYKQDSDGVDFQKETVTIFGLFITQSKLFEFIESFKYVPPPTQDKNNSLAFTWVVDNHANGWWEEVKELPHRPLGTIAQPEGFGEDILQKVRDFFDSPDKFRRLGIPFKLSFEISGPPGTGKTSLIRAVGFELKRDIYIISWKLFTDNSLWKALSLIPYGSLVLLEDYESNSNLWSDEYHDSLNVNSNMSKGSRWIDSNQPTLSGVLNAIDGIIPLNGLVLFWTTNRPEIIAAPVRREGRMDHKLVLGELEHNDIVRFIYNIFPDESDFVNHLGLDVRFKRIGGAQLSKLLLDSRCEAIPFIQSLPKEEQKGRSKPSVDMTAVPFGTPFLYDPTVAGPVVFPVSNGDLSELNANNVIYVGAEGGILDLAIPKAKHPYDLRIDESVSYSMNARLADDGSVEFLSVGVSENRR